MKTQTECKYVVVRKARGSNGVYKEVMTEPLQFENAKSENTGFNVMLKENDINYSVQPYNGKKIGEDY